MPLTPLPALFVLALAAIATTGCSVGVNLGDDAVRRVEHETITIDGPAVIELSTDNGRVDLIGGDVDDIEVEIVMRESRAGDADYSITTRGNIVDIDGACDGGWFRECAVEFLVTMPARTDATVVTDNGQITLADLDGRIDVRTDNGAITGESIMSERVRAVTDNGRVRLEFSAVPTMVDVHSDNGAIDVIVPDGTYDVDASTDNGSVDVAVDDDPSADRSITARSDNGSVDVVGRG